MLTKLAGIVLIGSVATLAVVGVTDLVGVTNLLERQHRNGHHRSKRRVEVRVERRIEREIEQNIERELEETANALSELEQGAHDPLVGTYVFDGNGEPLGFPWAAHLELELQPSGRFELRVKAELDGELTEETSWGKYRVDGDELTLYARGHDMEHSFRINGDRIELQGHRGTKFALKLAGVEDAALVKVPH
jgi:hypothetical protein